MRKIDIVAMASAAIIVLAGLATIYSIGVTSGEAILARQLLALFFGLILFLAAYVPDYRALSQYARIFYIAVLLALVAVLFWADDVRGSQRWLRVGGFNLQPVEFAKIALILMLSRFFAKKRGEVKNVKVLLHSALFAILPIVLVFLQPDLGSAILLFGIWFALLLFAPVKPKHIGILFLIMGLIGAAGWFGFLHDYQKQRIVSFLQPQLDPQGSGYNVRQAIIAVGSGEIMGRGLGHGYQSHLKFLPERHTDFIFASFSEEMGFVGALVLLGAFALLFWRLLKTALRSPDALGRYICLGVVALLGAQVTVNVGMNIGLLPVTGITLPLVSYGGSSLAATLFLLGLSQSVYRRSALTL